MSHQYNPRHGRGMPAGRTADQADPADPLATRQQSPVVPAVRGAEPTTTLQRTLAAITADVDRNVAELGTLARKAVAVAWRIGGYLLEARKACGHGEWRLWLAERGITKSTADRWMQLRRAFPQTSQVGTFGSVDEALKARPRALPAPETPPAPSPNTTSLTKTPAPSAAPAKATSTTKKTPARERKRRQRPNGKPARPGLDSRAREQRTVRLRVSADGGDRLGQLAEPLDVSRSKLVDGLAGVLTADLLTGLMADDNRKGNDA